MIKLITGYRDDQYVLIENEEAHKAYYLFNHPEARTVFSNGVTIIGKDIQGIRPDYHSDMGWNQLHKITGEDWHEIKKAGLENTYQRLLMLAKDISYLAEKNQDILKKTLSENKQLLLMN